jgi:osomolarity two-component system response regulator SSK1
MQQLNVRWDTAANGLEAVNKWKAGKFHLIFMDIGMPVMDGLAATKEIRRLERGGVNQDGDGPSISAPPAGHEPLESQRVVM